MRSALSMGCTMKVRVGNCESVDSVTMIKEGDICIIKCKQN